MLFVLLILAAAFIAFCPCMHISCKEEEVSRDERGNETATCRRACGAKRTSEGKSARFMYMYACIPAVAANHLIVGMHVWLNQVPPWQGRAFSIDHRCCTFSCCAMEPDKKISKQSCLQSRLPYISGNALSAMLKLSKAEQLPTEATSTRSLRRARDKEIDALTPYGKLHKKVSLSGTELEVQNPLALMYHLCKHSACFSGLMRELPASSPVAPLNLVIYADEVLPGNPLAVTQERKLWCFYWSILEFGAAALSDEEHTAHTHTHTSSAEHATPRPNIQHNDTTRRLLKHISTHNIYKAWIHDMHAGGLVRGCGRPLFDREHDPGWCVRGHGRSVALVLWL